MASLAEIERELIVERTRAELEVARALGRKGGRRRSMTDSKIVSTKRLLSSATLYRWLLTVVLALKELIYQFLGEYRDTYEQFLYIWLLLLVYYLTSQQ